MRVALIGASPLAVATAEMLVKRGHDVILIERDKEKIDALADTIDCGLVHGDGTRPAILREVNPADTDFLFCLTENDQDNILASLVGRSLGFARVVTKIEDAEFEHICLELGLSDTIIPDSAIARTLVDMVAGQALPELSTIVRGEVRFFSFAVREEDEMPVGELELPARTRAVCVYRDEDFILPEPDTGLSKGDEVVLITHSENVPELSERFRAALRSLPDDAPATDAESEAAADDASDRKR
jgi:trk system potassium uptake protein TrkA